MHKFVITGGPCGGKTQIMSYLVENLERRGYKVLIVPEAATELINGGIKPGVNISFLEFQKLVLKNQIEKENIWIDAAKYYDDDKVVILTDRGILDNCAYVESKEAYSKILETADLTFSDAFNRYDEVFFLVTAANGAEEFYQWNDPSKETSCNNAARSESPKDAIVLDEKTLNAWTGHNHLNIFDNSTDFEGKKRKVLETVFRKICEPIPKEVERKFLIRKPAGVELENLGYFYSCQIFQAYLKELNKGVERRVRQRGSILDGYNYFYTEKTPVSYGVRLESDSLITAKEYTGLLTQIDPKLHPINKNRYCFVYGGQYFELDIYPFSNEYAILELEVSKITDEIYLPNQNLEIIKEVTGEDEFTNKSLARSLSF